MKYSIIIPAYNAEQTIEKSIRSLLNQTYRDFEAIIIDDGSTDRTGKAVLDIIRGDERFRYYKQGNAGVSAARNKGISMATGDFILFLDSDDQYHLDYLDTLEHTVLSYPDMDHFWCGYEIVSSGGKKIGERGYKHLSDKEVIEDRSHIVEIQNKELVAPLWNKAFRRDIVERYHIRMDERLSLGEDLLFCYEYLDKGRTQIVMICRPLYHYTVSGASSLDSRYRSDLREILERLDREMYAYLKKWRVSNDQMEIFYRHMFWHYERILHNTYRRENRMGFREKLKYNLEIMKSVYFQTSLNYAESGMHPFYKIAYRRKNYLAVLFLDFAAKAKKRILRKK